jgi:formate hydrogenlyase subunit 3/multisubunit Na+/H+ antiporter MnhD subunit
VSADWLLVLLLMLPVTGVLVIVAAGEARAEPIALGTIAATSLVAALAVGRIVGTQQPLAMALGGFAPPLGLALRADGPSTVLLTVAAVVMLAVGVFAAAERTVLEDDGRSYSGACCSRCGAGSTPSPLAATCSTFMSRWNSSPSPPCRWSASMAGPRC